MCSLGLVVNCYVPEIKFNNEIQIMCSRYVLRIVHELGERVSSNLNNPTINLPIS